MLHRPKNYHFYKNAMRVLLFLFFLALVPGVAARIFGSSGFDSGGDDPVCFRSMYSDDDKNNGTSSSNIFASDDAQALAPNDPRDIDSINDVLYNKTLDVTTDLLPSCYRGTKLQVNLPDNLQSRTLVRGDQYTFPVKLSTDFREALEGLDEQESSIANTSLASPEVIVCWFRLVLCDAFSIGFCSPFLESAAESSSTSTSTRRRLRSKDMSRELQPNPYQYTEGTPLGGEVSGFNDEFVSTRWVSWKLRPDEETAESIYKAAVDLSFVMPEQSESEPSGRDGVYFFLAHAVIYVRTPNGTAFRLDIADSVPNNILTVKSPPRIHKVTNSFVIGISVVIGIFALACLCTLIFIVKNRTHQIMVLSQAGLLASLTGLGLWSVVCSFLFIPLHDVFCRLSGPLVLIPMTGMAAITVARLWRVYSTLNVALGLGRDVLDKQGKRMNRPSWIFLTEDRVMGVLSRLAYVRIPFLGRKSKGQMQSFEERRSSLRQKTNAADSVYLVVLLSLPQVILQIFEASYFNLKIVIDLDESGKIGREVCDAEGSEWTMYLGIVLLAMMHILAVLVAWFSRNLPSAFNEKDAIFHAASINGVVCMIIIALLFVTDSPETSPDLTSLLWIILVVSLTVISNFHLVLPKVQRVRSGEKVIISSMLRRVNDYPSESGGVSGSTIETDNTNVSGLDFPPSPSKVRFSTGPKPRRIKLKADDPIPKSVETEMHFLKELLHSTTNKALEGRPIELEDWILLKAKASAFHLEVDRVDCEWESTAETSRNGGSSQLDIIMPLDETE